MRDKLQSFVERIDAYDKILCIYHRKDFDGVASRAIMQHRWPQARMLGWDYSDSLPDITRYKDHAIVMADVSFPAKNMVELAMYRDHPFLFIDHHMRRYQEIIQGINEELGADPGTAEPAGYTESSYGENYMSVFAPRQSAAELTWRALRTPPSAKTRVPFNPIITLIGRYDTWRQEEGDWEGTTLPFQCGLRLRPLSPKYFPEEALADPRRLEVLVESFVNKTIDQGRVIMQYQEEENKKDMHGAYEAPIQVDGETFLGLFCNGAAHNSLAFKSRYVPTRHDFVSPYRFNGREWVFSFYTDSDEVDCSAIARHFGGGGHKKAAGCQVADPSHIFQSK